MVSDDCLGSQLISGQAMSLDKGSMPAPIHVKTIHCDADERLKGFGHVEFATPEAAHKAFKMNGGDPSRDSKYSVIIIIAYSTHHHPFLSPTLPYSGTQPAPLISTDYPLCLSPYTSSPCIVPVSIHMSSPCMTPISILMQAHYLSSPHSHVLSLIHHTHSSHGHPP